MSTTKNGDLNFTHNASSVQVHIQKNVIQSHYKPELPRGFQEVKVPRLRDNGPGWC